MRRRGRRPACRSERACGRSATSPGDPCWRPTTPAAAAAAAAAAVAAAAAAAVVETMGEGNFLDYIHARCVKHILTFASACVVTSLTCPRKNLLCFIESVFAGNIRKTRSAVS